MTSRRGFTLVEVLVAVMLTGILTTLALAPVVVTVRRAVETQEEYSDLSALSRTINIIARDLFSAMRISSNVVTIKDHEAIGGHDDDVLMVMSTSTIAQDMPPGTIVYKIAEGGILHSNIIPGLYRWIFPGKLPNTINIDTLNGDEGQLVLPGVNEFCVEVPVNSHEDERRKEYTGLLPKGIYIKIGRLKNEQDRENNLNELESVIVFP